MKTFMHYGWLLMLSALLAISLQAYAKADEAAASFAAADVFDLEFANDPRISPDGSQIVYERRANDIMTDSTLSSLWIVAVDGSRHRPLVSGTVAASSPRWSPEGDRIAYLQSTGSGTGIFDRWLDSGQTALLANLQKSPAELSWSPDGRWLAFVMPVTATSEPIARPREAPEGAVWSGPVKVIDTAQYRWDGEGFLETAYEHIFLVPADGGTPRQLTSGDFNHSGPLSFTPGGEAILFAGNRQEGWQLTPGEVDIYSISVVDGALTQLTSRAGGETSPTMSPNGHYIAYVYDDNRKVSYRNQVLHVMSTDDDDDTPLTTGLDTSVSNIQWAGNRQVFFQYDERAIRKVARVTLDGDVQPVASGLGSTSLGRPYLSGSFTVAGNGTVAHTKGTAYRPAEVAAADRRGERVLTALNDDLLNNRSLGTVSEIIYTSSFDGQEIQGWYITPPDYDAGRKYPLILEIHGGPHLAYGAYFSAEMQLMAAAGYVVFYDNHRGSTSYGEDFAMLLHYNYSSTHDFADHMSGVDAMIAKGIADPDNLFITGGSAGGIASAYAIGLTDRFNAAAVAKPVVNWISKTLTADSYIEQIHYQFPGMPWDEFAHYWKRSPLSLVGNMTTPTLLITGEEDYRTPISETEQLYQALTLKGVDVVMVRVPGSPHGIAGKPSRLNAKVDNILAWFARYRTDLPGDVGE
jgi:dipeptidyl aminopeptidase/acylaminoacyl peptidase